MSSMKWLFGGFLLLFLMASVFATPFGTPNLRESQVSVVPDEAGTMLEISVLVFEPATSSTGTNIREVMEEINDYCQANPDPDFQTCMQREGLARTASSTGYDVNLTSLQGAEITVEYYNSIAGEFNTVDGCENLVTDTLGTAYRPGETGELESIEYYYTQCDISDFVEGRRSTVLRILYTPHEDDIRSSFTEYQFDNAAVTPSSEWTAQLNDYISALSEGGGVGIGVPSTLPCVGAFLIAGLLLASLYFAGKSPISLLDITTPRLPAPKGVTAGGQILAPFGYGEMSRTAAAKMSAALGAMAPIVSRMRAGMRGDTELEHLRGLINSRTGTAADRAAGLGPGRQLSEAAVTGGRSLGMSASQLEHLTELPYHWGHEQHRTVAQIISGLEAQGGRGMHLAMQIRDCLYIQRLQKTLGALGGDADIGVRSPLIMRANKFMDMFIGSNRYSQVGTAFGAGRAAAIRSARVTGKMAKAVVTQAPTAARGITKTTMEMIGGRRAMEDLAARARTSGTAAWVHGQLTKHPARVKIADAFPVLDKMGHLYETLNKEAHANMDQYLLKQWLRGKNIRLDLSEEELGDLGHKNIDILERSGYNKLTAAELAQLQVEQAEIRRILTSELGPREKMLKLMEFVQAHGAAPIDDKLMAFANRLDEIHTSAQPDYLKMIELQQALEEQNKIRMSAYTGGKMDENAFVSYVGGGSLHGTQIWETMVLRTMIWDAENGFLAEGAGIREEIISAKLNVANRLTGLDPTAGAHQLVDHMRSNPAELAAVAKRNREELISLLSEDGVKMFQKMNKKSINEASVSDIVRFLQGGEIQRSLTIDPKTGKALMWEADEALPVPKGAALVDLKRHWITSIEPEHSFAIGQWVENRHTRSYVPPFKASIEAELDRMPGSANWDMNKRTLASKKLWVAEELRMDMEQRFNSHFGHNTYGTTAETHRFYSGILAGFMERALEEKGLPNNHPDYRFVKGMDIHNAKDLNKLGDVVRKYDKELNAVMKKPFTYDDLARSGKAHVMLHEGGIAMYHKGMMLGDYDRVMGGEPAIRDRDGTFRKFIAEDVALNFQGNTHLNQELSRVHSSANPAEWTNLLEAAKKWAREGKVYDAEREKQYAALCWNYAQTTNDYGHFWQNAAVEVRGKRTVTPAAPSALRYFGVEAPKFTKVYQHFRNMGLHGLDYVTEVALISGKTAHNASYDVTLTSHMLKDNSWHMANTVLSGRGMEGMSDTERVALRNAAMQHHAYHSAWIFAVDRNPQRTSGSSSTYASWAAGFHHGPTANYDVRTNLRAFLSRGEYANFMTTYGFPMDLAGYVMRPFTNMIRAMQMSMMGYACRYDQQFNSLRVYNYTQPRLREAMQAVNPFAFRWFPGKTSERMQKLNVFGGSLEQHHLQGPEQSKGLAQSPSDLFVNRKGIYAHYRTMHVNPGLDFLNYRSESELDAPQAEFAYRNREASYIYNEKVRQAAMNNTVRRTVSAEALAIRRDQELRGFGAMQNPLYGWANPIAFAYHMPFPLFPTSMAPRDIIARWVGKVKHGYGQSFSDRMGRLAESAATGTARMFQPHKLHMVCYCPKCGTSNYRGSRCKNSMCNQPQY